MKKKSRNKKALALMRQWSKTRLQDELMNLQKQVAVLETKVRDLESRQPRVINIPQSVYPYY